jgi:hypothetical protein
MPKTAIYKDRNFLRAKRKVGSTRQCQMASPPNDVVEAKDFDQSTFGPFVPRAAYLRHHAGSVGW